MRNRTSYLVIGILTLFFCINFSRKIETVSSTKDNCIIAYDALGYYMYLPLLFQTGRLDFNPDDVQEMQNINCQNIETYQLSQRPNGHYINIYHMGQALIWFPSYFIGDSIAKFSGYEQNGFSTPYLVCFLMNVLLFVFLGLLYLRKLLLLFFDDKTTTLTILLIYFFTNLLATFLFSFQLQHLYLFALNAAFLYHLINYSKNRNKRNLVISVIIFGLTTFIRPTQVIWALIPLILFYKEVPLKELLFRKLIWFPISSIIFNIPHFLYWKLVGDSWFLPNLHTENIVLTDPNLIDFLFSYRKGWVLYSPIFLFLVLGFIELYKHNRKFFWASLIFTFCNIYVLSSWECWWYASSFGQRVMVDSYPLLAILIGYSIIYINKGKLIAFFSYALLFGFLILNIIQTLQYQKGLLHATRMSKQHYWYIFGKPNIDNYQNHRLLIDKLDTSWIHNENILNDPNLLIKKSVVFKKSNLTHMIGNENLTIGKFELNQFESDEVLFEILIDCIVSDSSKSVQFKFEQTGKHGTYSWFTEEISMNNKKNGLNHYHFKVNEADLRHSNDYIQIYTYSSDKVNLKILDIKVIAHSLHRK